MLLFVPDHLIMREMCNGIMRTMPGAFHRIADRFITQELCIKAVEVEPWQLYDAPNYFKTKGMCDKAVRDYLISLQFVPDWLVTQQQIDTWYDDDYVYNDNEMIKWYGGYKKCKNERRASTYCLASRSCDGLVYVRR